MRPVLLAAAALLAISSARAETLWVAEARVVSATSKCADTVAVGDFFRAIYRPMGTTIGNGANSHLTFFSQRSTFWMRVPNNTFRSGINYVGYYITSTLSFAGTSGGILDWQESAAFGAPVASNVTASIANFFGDQAMHRDVAHAVHPAALSRPAPSRGSRAATTSVKGFIPPALRPASEARADRRAA